MTFILAIGGAALSLSSVQWAMLAWFAALCFFWDWVGNTEWTVRLTPRKKVATQVVCVMVVALVSAYPIYRQYIKQEAATLEGDITAGEKAGSNRNLELGDSGAILSFNPYASGVMLHVYDDKFRNETGKEAPQIKFLYDAGLRIEMGDNGPEISTPIRDRSGQIIAEISKNHWKVAPFPQCWDKNHTKNSLEVLDSSGHVVMQVKLLPDRVQLQGEWHDQFGHGVQMLKCKTESGGGGCWALWPTPEREQAVREFIKPIFKYPSSEHLGELMRP